MISCHSSEVVPVIHQKWLLSFIGSGRMLRNIDGYSSKVAIFAVRGARDFLASLMDLKTTSQKTE